jgi:tyrosinase
MTTFVRANAWAKGGTFANTDLLWYAKGVGVMQTRALDDPSSWWFFGAIHGEYVTENGFPGWGDLPSPPAVPTTPQPSQTIWDLYWDQCQHQTWYFLPWHRGYLLALEATVRQAVVSLGGPASWSLPYWNYFGPKTEFKIPPAFTKQTLPDGSPNPLFVSARYGPDGDGKIYIPTPAVIAKHPSDPNFAFGPVTQDCMSNDLFTGSDAVTKQPGFGGPTTGFSHGGGTSGNLEGNPHNLVHVYVGGNAPDGQTYGLMADPGLAALDPIFYLHHANIDRMWAVWNQTPTNKNPSISPWPDGPAKNGEHEFVMPMPGATPWVYTPSQMDSLSKVGYTYDQMLAPAVVQPGAVLAARLTRLGAAAAAAKVQGGAPMAAATRTELVGASQAAIPIGRTGATTSVTLDPAARGRVSASLDAAVAGPTPEAAEPDRVFLNLENVRGTHDASVLSVYLNLPPGAAPADHPELLAGSAALFGLRRASRQDGEHAGQGLSFILDITKIVDALHLGSGFDVDTLPVRIVPNAPIPDQAQITVGRVSIYREGR